jgi:hypothetical protein
MLDIFRGFLDLLAALLITFVRENQRNLEPLNRQFGEYYLGRPLRAMYVPPPSGPSLGRPHSADPEDLKKPPGA